MLMILSSDSIEVGHFDGGYRSLVAFIAVYATSSVDGLLHGIVRQQTKDEGNLLGQVELRDALGNSRTDVFKMRRIPTYDTTQNDDSIHIVPICNDSGTKDKLKTAWNPLYDNV